MTIAPKISSKMDELGTELRTRGRQLHMSADHLADDAEARLQGNVNASGWGKGYEMGEIPAMRADISECRNSLDEYEQQLNLCQAQINLEAAEVLDIPDLDTRTKTLLVQFGCRSALDIHKADRWDLRAMLGFGRKCQEDCAQWRDAHFDENQAAWKVEIDIFNTRYEATLKESEQSNG